MHAHTHLSSICSGDYDPLTKFCLGPFNDSVDQLSFNVSIVNDNIPEDDEMFSARLGLHPTDQARISNCVTVTPDVPTVTILMVYTPPTVDW